MNILSNIIVAISLLLFSAFSNFAQQTTPEMLSPNVVLLEDPAGITHSEWLEIANTLKAYVLSGEGVDVPYKKISSLEGYKFQLFTVEYDEKPAIVMNAMCEELNGWKETYQQTIDGGKCYFTVIYDRQSQKVVHYFINSEA